MAKEPIPALRTDLEWHHRANGLVDVRDPHLLQIYTLDATDYRIAREFDGTTAEDLLKRLTGVGGAEPAKANGKANGVAKSAKAAPKNGKANGATGAKAKNGKSNGVLEPIQERVTLARLRAVAKEFDELRLLDRPEVWDEEPNVDNVSPYSQIDTKKGLRVLPVADDPARWTCHGCGVCCHGLAVEISKAEEKRIDASLYQDILHGQAFAEDSFLNPDEPAKRTLRQDSERNNACIFLSPEGLCYVHARQGMEAKPDACQIFPAMVMMVPGGAPRLGLRTNCASMYKSFEDGPAVSDLVPHVKRIASQSEVHVAPDRVRWFGKRVAWKTMDRVCQDIRETFDEQGLTAETILALDKKHFDGRVRKGQKRYGKHVLEYIGKEGEGPAPVEEGAYRLQIGRLPRGGEALQSMKAGVMPVPVPKKVEAFLRAQIAHVLYIGGPLNLPDAGYGLVGIMLGLLGALHAVGPRGTLKGANAAFEVFMMPLLETMEHAWPILDALDAKYAAKLREELS